MKEYRKGQKFIVISSKVGAINRTILKIIETRKDIFGKEYLLVSSDTHYSKYRGRWFDKNMIDDLIKQKLIKRIK
jgi:hypothetical protein